MVKQADWVTNESEIVAQIFFAVGSTCQVAVTHPLGEFVGTILDPDGRGLRIAPMGAIPALPPGSPLCVEHDGADDNYRFYTEVAAVEGGVVRTIRPYAAESTDRRLGERVQVGSDGGFHFRAKGPAGTYTFALHDISTGGVSFIDERDTGILVGQSLMGELLLPGEPSFPVCLQVRHMHLRRAQLLVGARLTAMSLRNQIRLARFLAEWTSRPNA